MALRFALAPVGFVLLVSSSYGADEKKPPAAPKVQAPRPAPKAVQNKQPQQPDNHPGEQLFDRLSRMTPEQREKALQNLPPAQRQKIRNQLNEIQKWPTAAQNRARARLEMLNSLPLQRQNQVKRSARQLLDLPADRQESIKTELQRMAPLPDDERRAYMNTEEFRNRYSANEQQIMSNLSLVEPQTPPKD